MPLQTLPCRAFQRGFALGARLAVLLRTALAGHARAFALLRAAGGGALGLSTFNG